jgi:outer membrane protein assembly factor BamB
MKQGKLLLLLLIFIGCGCSDKAQNNYLKQWPQFRGPFAGGIVESVNLPDKWDIKTNENIKWKIEIPGMGHSCPVIWEDKIFITTAIREGGTDALKAGLYGDVDNVNDSTIHEFRLMCINKYSGKILWNQLAIRCIPKTKRHTKASHSDPSPAINGKYVVAFFGSNGLYCYNFDGELKWKKDFGKMNAGFYITPDIEWDISSSPIIHKNTVVVQCDILGEGFITALDIETGIEKWRIPRKNVSTYSTPNFYNSGDIQEIIVNGYENIGGYDFNTGAEIWKLKGGGDIPVPSPFFADGIIYIHSAHGKNSPIFAIKPEAKGDISLNGDSTSNKFIAWSIKRGAAYIPTDLVYGGYLYNLREGSGKLTCFDAKTGKLIYEESLPDAREITASGIASNGRLYFTSEQGTVFVVKAGNTFELISKNPLDDLIMATPAISEEMLFFRTQHYLIAVGKK